jgi:hypothetical protein
LNSSRYLQNYLCTIHGSTVGTATVDKDRNGKAPSDFWVVKKATSTIQNSGNFDGWRRHEIGWVKCNVDASFMTNEKSGSWGAVVRDHHVYILGSAWNTINHF